MPVELPDHRKLKELLKVLRAQGVLQYQTDSLNLVLSEGLPTPAGSSRAEDTIVDMDEDPSLEIERLIDYSSKHPTSEE